jgi:hypothetical protein
MHLGQPIKHFLSMRGSLQTNTAAVRRIRRAFKQALLRASID